MITKPLKKLCWLFCFVALLFSVSAESYPYNVVHIDKFLCGDSYLQGYSDKIINIPKLNKSLSYIFNKTFTDDVLYFGFEINRTWDGDSLEIFYFLTKGGVDYRIETDGNWFYIEATPKQNFILKSFEIHNVSQDIGFIKYSLRAGINEATDLECRAGSDEHNPLLYILNIYNYPVDTLNCPKKQGDFIIDCSRDVFVQDLLETVWGPPDWQKRLSYRWGENRIFVDLFSLEFNQENKFDKMRKPMVVLSASDFVGNLRTDNSGTHMSGQNVFVDHFDYLYMLSELPILISHLNEDINKTTLFADTIRNRFSDVKEAWQLGKYDDVKKIVLNNPPLDDEIKLYSNRVYMYINDFYSKKASLSTSQDNYYEGMYYPITTKYLAIYDAQILILEKKISDIIQLQNLYDTYSSNVLANIHEFESTKESLNLTTKTLWWTILALLITMAIQVFTSVWSEKLKVKSIIAKLHTWQIFIGVTTMIFICIRLLTGSSNLPTVSHFVVAGILLEILFFVIIKFVKQTKEVSRNAKKK